MKVDAKPTSKEQLFLDLAAKGWVKDERYRVAKDRYSRETVPGRNAWLRPAAHGGQWRILLEWTRSGSSWQRQEGNRLMKVHIFHVSADIEYKTGDTGYDHTPYTKVSEFWNSDNEHYMYRHSFLWDALKWNGKDDTVGTLRQGLTHLISDPDTALWLGFQEEYEYRLRQADADAKAKTLAEAKARKLPVTVDQENPYSSEWRTLTWNLYSAAEAVKSADGTSNLPLLVANAQKAMDAIIASLSHDARLNYMAYMTGEGTLSNL